MILKRRKPQKMGLRQQPQIRCAGHLKWVRGHECILAGRFATIRAEGGGVDRQVGPHACEGKIEAMHVRMGTDGGTSIKPGDNWTVPGCSKAHREQHQIGEQRFGRRYAIDLKRIAAELWQASPHGKRYRMEHEVNA